MPGRPDNRDHAVYPIGMVQRLTGLTGRQIRYYEQHGLLRPKRTRGNHRLYTLAQVERLKTIRDLIRQGMSIVAVREWLATHAEACHLGDRNDERERRRPPGSAPVRYQPEATARRGEAPESESGHRSKRSRPFDQERLVIELARHPQLSSLYPVNNQAALSRLLHVIRRREDDSASE